MNTNWGLIENISLPSPPAARNPQSKAELWKRDQTLSGTSWEIRYDNINHGDELDSESGKTVQRLYLAISDTAPGIDLRSYAYLSSMPCCLSTAFFSLFFSLNTKWFNRTSHNPNASQSGICHGNTPIHILDDDALLNIFYIYRPDLTDEEEYSENTVRVLQGGRWSREGWWYRLAHVCRRWRHLILASPSHLGLHLVCTYGTPIAKMLAHSPPLPLIIDYINEHRQITAKDAKGILLALNYRDRVHRIRLLAPVRRLQALVTSMKGHFPQLEFLYIAPLSKHRTSLILPRTFRASHLRHLVLINFAFPVQSPFPTTTTSLVTLSLQMIHPSAYFPPSDLLPQLSLMPQLETLGIGFHSPLPNRDVERQLLDHPSMIYVTLPNLRWFGFEGASAYLGALLSRISTPLLERLQIILHDQLTTTTAVSQLLQFMGKARRLRLRFRGLKFNFGFRGFLVTAYPDGASDVCSLYMFVSCTHLDRQVTTMAQIFNVLGPVFSEVECLTLKYRTATLSSQRNVMVDGARWRELLQPFSHVKTLVLLDGLVRELSHSLLLDDGELPPDLLPELTELVYSTRGHAEYPFSPFINARQISGHPVRLVHGDLLP